MHKTCNVCGIEKALTEFPKNGVDKDGSTRHRADCKECYNINRKLNKKKVNKFINNTKHRTGEEDSYTFADWKDAMMFFRGTCAYCGESQSRRVKLTKEHVVAVSKGGKTVRSNIIPACSSCNSSKSDSDFDTWYFASKHYNKEREERIKQWIRENS